MKTNIDNLRELAAEVVMGWTLETSTARPFWITPKGDRKPYSWNPMASAGDQEEMVNTLSTYAVSKEAEGYYFTVYQGGEAYEGFHQYKRVAAIIAALAANGMEVEVE